LVGGGDRRSSVKEHLSYRGRVMPDSFLRRRGRRRLPSLLVISCYRFNRLVVELPRDQTHRLWAVSAESLPPHLQLECCIMRVLSGKIRDRRGLASAAFAMACTARGDALRWITRLGEFTSFLN
jgi:hypothetical protein